MDKPDKPKIIEPETVDSDDPLNEDQKEPEIHQMTAILDRERDDFDETLADIVSIYNLFKQ
jgi:hypothetical protein